MFYTVCTHTPCYCFVIIIVSDLMYNPIKKSSNLNDYLERDSCVINEQKRKYLSRKTRTRPIYSLCMDFSVIWSGGLNALSVAFSSEGFLKPKKKPTAPMHIRSEMLQ